MAEKKNKPEIRFKGFSDEWGKSKLGDLSLIGDIDHKMPQSVNNGIPYLMTGDFVGINGLDLENSKKISTEDYEQLAKKIKPEVGDILFARYASIGAVRFVETQVKFLVSYSCAILKRNDTVNGKYLYYYLQANQVQGQLELEINTGSQRNIGIDSLKKLIILLPIRKEQQKVAIFLTNLDHLITLHQRKYDKLVTVKKAMLEKMFPKDGAVVPEIRFKGFTEDWEERKLGEICLIGDIDHKMPQSVTDGIPYLMTGDFVGNTDLNFLNSKLISIQDYEQLSKKIKPEAGDIILARYASVGAVRYVETQMKFLVSYSCAILKHNDSDNGKYLFYYLQANEVQRQIELEINTGSQRNIGIDSLKKIIILLPPEREQEKIAIFLTNLDTLINLQQHELEKLQNIKNACLEKMFV